MKVTNKDQKVIDANLKQEYSAYYSIFRKRLRTGIYSPNECIRGLRFGKQILIHHRMKEAIRQVDQLIKVSAKNTPPHF